MRIQQRSEHIARLRRRFLLTFLAVMSASGCVNGPGGSELRHSPYASRPQFSATGEPRVQETDKSIAWESEVRPAAYSQDLVMSAPATAIVLQDNLTPDEVSNGKKETNAGADSLDVDPTESSLAEPVAPLPLDSLSTEGTQQPEEYFVSLALSRHPKIRAARQRVAAAINVAPQVSALPDPMFNNIFWPLQNQALQTAGGRVGNQFQLSQGVPWPEKLRTKAAIATREVQMAQAEADRIEREITEAVRLAYYEVWFATRAIEIINETRDLVDDLTQVAEARYQSGGTQQDVLRAQLETDRLDDQLITLRKQKEMAQADLAALVQQPLSLMPETSQEIGLTDVPKQLDGLIAQAEQCSPELRAIVWEIQRDRQKQRLAWLQKYPDLQLGLNYAIISDNSNVLSPVANGHDNISFTVGTTLPIWREKINAGIREAANRTSSSTQRLEAERDVLYGKLRRLLAQADALVEQKEIYNNRIIPRTEDTLKLAIADYRGKRTDFFTLIETYRELLMFETQLARFDASLAGTVAQIERTVGCP